MRDIYDEAGEELAKALREEAKHCWNDAPMVNVIKIMLDNGVKFWGYTSEDARPMSRVLGDLAEPSKTKFTLKFEFEKFDHL